MTSYAVGLGWNVPDIDLIPVDCRGGEVLTERSYSDGGTREELLYARPVFDMLEDDASFQAAMALFDVLDNEVAAVTWRTRSQTLEWVRYNGWAKQPRVGADGSRRDYFLKDYVITIADLVAVEEV